MGTRRIGSADYNVDFIGHEEGQKLIVWQDDMSTYLWSERLGSHESEKFSLKEIKNICYEKGNVIHNDEIIPLLIIFS